MKSKDTATETESRTGTEVKRHKNNGSTKAVTEPVEKVESLKSYSVVLSEPEAVILTK